LSSETLAASSDPSEKEKNMRRISLRPPSAAAVIACLALGIALGGTGSAAVLNVPDGSVTTAKIKNGAVTTAKLKNDAVTVDKLAANAVRTAQVKNGTLLKEDFKSGQLSTGPAGPPGPPGPRGVPGPKGAPGVSGLERVDASTSSSSANSKSVVATCPSGKKVIGGGAQATGSGANKVSINQNFPDSAGNKWNAQAVEVVSTGQSWQLQAYGLCANVS
jgi:hypothetical protein